MVVVKLALVRDNIKVRADKIMNIGMSCVAAVLHNICHGKF